MFYRRKIYQMDSEEYEVFNEFFHEYLLPNQTGQYLTVNTNLGS
ncbi:hypothetical protein [Piscibacillus halophilus]|nr:hypothetical protein [Piscibacillus halophilus]